MNIYYHQRWGIWIADVYPYYQYPAIGYTGYAQNTGAPYGDKW